jgi:hypothetical protein
MEPEKPVFEKVECLKVLTSPNPDPGMVFPVSE